MSAPHTTGLAASASGALIGLALTEHNGVPIYFIIAVLALALGFGIWASAARPKDPVVRKELLRLARVNAGVLFVISVSMTFALNLSLPAATMMVVIMGLVGSDLIDKLQTTQTGQGMIEAIAGILALLAKGGK